MELVGYVKQQVIWPFSSDQLQNDKEVKKKYYHTKESVDEYIELAKDVNGEGLIEKLKQELAANSLLLEIGSGPGSDWKILSNTFKVIGSDNSLVFLDHLATQYPHGRFIELDAVTLNTRLRFNGIYSNKVLHHLSDAELLASTKRQYDVLMDDGIICHSFWKGEGSEEFKGLFVNYHTEESLRAVFTEFFEMKSIDSYEEFEESDSLLLIGRKKRQ